jgi:ribonuclease-3
MGLTPYLKGQRQEFQPKKLVVYNEHNRPLTSAGIHQIWARYLKGKLPVTETTLAAFQQALTHRTYDRTIILGLDNKRRKKGDLVLRDEKSLRKYWSKGVMELQDGSYDRLELAGDSIFHATITKYMLLRFPKQDEGFLTRLRAKVEKGKTMSKIAKQIGLDKWLVISAEMEALGKRTDEKILEDSFEAMLGVMYMYYGHDKCEEIVQNICRKDIDFPALLYYDDNFKDQLLRYNHLQHWKDPKYGFTLNEDKTYTAWVMDAKGKPVEYGRATDKVTAEQLAAKRVLEKLGMIGKNGETYMNSRDLEAVMVSDKPNTTSGKLDFGIRIGDIKPTNPDLPTTTSSSSSARKKTSHKDSSRHHSGTDTDGKSTNEASSEDDLYRKREVKNYAMAMDNRMEKTIKKDKAPAIKNMQGKWNSMATSAEENSSSEDDSDCSSVTETSNRMKHTIIQKKKKSLSPKECSISKSQQTILKKSNKKSSKYLTSESEADPTSSNSDESESEETGDSDSSHHKRSSSKKPHSSEEESSDSMESDSDTEKSIFKGMGSRGKK